MNGLIETFRTMDTRRTNGRRSLAHLIKVMCFFDEGTPEEEAGAEEAAGGLREMTRQASGLVERWMMAALSSRGEAEQPWWTDRHGRSRGVDG